MEADSSVMNPLRVLILQSVMLYVSGLVSITERCESEQYPPVQYPFRERKGETKGWGVGVGRVAERQGYTKELFSFSEVTLVGVIVPVC